MSQTPVIEGPRRRWFEPRLGLHAWLHRFLPESIILLLYALVIGVIGGFGAVGFRKLINLFNVIFFIHVKSGLWWLGRADVFLLPVIGLFVVSVIVHYFAPEAKGHGVPEVMAAISEKGSIIRPRVVIIKAVASALCIGSGGSVGREGPIVQIGSAFGSVLGQYLGLPERYLRLLVGCGAGAGIAATFNAPIGGVMFATEVILGSFTLQNFTAIVISSVVSAGIGRAFFGNHASFPLPVYQVGHFSIFWIYVALGILAGLWGFVYIRVLYQIEDWFEAIHIPFWAKAIAGGAIVGLIGIFFPQIFGVGYDTVDLALLNHLGLGLLIVLLVLKLIATSVTIAAGGSGGVFSPGLYMGSMLGGAVGVLMANLMPHSGISPGALAAIAMAGVFAGSAQAPVTSIMMLFEMTGDYQIILPIMITSVIAVTITSTFAPDTIYTKKLIRRGIDFYRKRQADRMQAVTVGEALTTGRLSIEAVSTIGTAWRRFSETGEWYAYIRDSQGTLLGSVARAQVLEAMNQGLSDEPVHQLLPTMIHQISEQAALSDALRMMNDLGVTYLLVYRGNHPIGVIGSSDIVHAYKDA